MLSQKTIDKLKELGFNPQALIDAAKAENEVDVDIPEGKLYKDTDLEARDANMKAEGKKLGVAEGKTAGFEIANKQIIDKFGLEGLSKTDDLSKILDASFAAASKGDEGLKGQVSQLLKDKETWAASEEGYKKQIDEIRFESTLLAQLPKNRSGILSDNEYLSLIKGSIKEADGVKAIEFGGEVLRDPQTRAILPIEKGIEKIFASREGWLKQEQSGGRGEGDKGGGSGGSTPKTWTEAQAKWTELNPDKPVSSPEFISYAQSLAAKDKDFKIDE